MISKGMNWMTKIQMLPRTLKQQITHSLKPALRVKISPYYKLYCRLSHSFSLFFRLTVMTVLLSPLKHPSELSHHSMADAYTNKALKTMVDRIDSRLRTERHSLWQAKKVYRQFLGDAVWIPCGAVETGQDRNLFQSSPIGLRSVSPSRELTTLYSTLYPRNTDSVIGPSLSNNVDGTSETDDKLVDYSNNNRYNQVENNIPHVVGEVTNQFQPASWHTLPSTTDSIQNNLTLVEHEDNQSANDYEPTKSGASNVERDANGQGSHSLRSAPDDHNGVSHSSEDRLKRIATLQSSPSWRADSESAPTEPHPLFNLPQLSHLDSNGSLPPGEAEETRHMLWAYIQKQGESVRLFSEMLEMLRKAYRMKEEVWEWCRAEAHVGDMSDGEDWYDKECWGLAEGDDLRKGADEEDVEGQDESRATGKRGRGRRT